MKTENKQSWMIWTIVVLAILNISTLTTIFVHHRQMKKMSMNEISQTDNDAEKYCGRYFRDQLDFSSTQMDKFKSFNPIFRQQARSITLDLSRLRVEILSEMAAKQSDTIRLNMLADSVGLLHSQLKKLTSNYYINIKSICDTAQQTKLKIIFSEMIGSESSIDCNKNATGKGMGQEKCKNK